MVRLEQVATEQHTQGLYFRRNIRVYEAEAIHVAKPAERRFWTGSSAYEDGGGFAAIRIPAAKDGRALTGSLVGRSDATYGDLKAAEQGALEAVRAYARRTLGIGEAMKRITMYDSMLGARVYERNQADRERLYRELLRRRPWDRCPCPICGEIGVEVAIFRGNNRNRRRGFHNLWVLRRRIERASGHTPAHPRRRSRGSVPDAARDPHPPVAAPG